MAFDLARLNNCINANLTASEQCQYQADYARYQETIAVLMAARDEITKLQTTSPVVSDFASLVVPRVSPNKVS